MTEKVLSSAEIPFLNSKGENKTIPSEKASKGAESALYRPLLCFSLDLHESCVHKTKLYFQQHMTEIEILHLFSVLPSLLGLFPIDTVFLSDSFFQLPLGN